MFMGSRRALLVSASHDAPQTKAFLARTSGLSATERAAYKTLINGLVSDGTFSLLDCLYIFATNTTTTANLNLISTSFTLSQTGSVTFSADHGYTGDALTGFLDTGFVPSSASGNFTQNSASFGVYVLTNRSSNQTYAEIGCDNSTLTSTSYIVPLWSDGKNYMAVNENGTSTSQVGSNAQGMWINSRTGASTAEEYLNGSANLADSNASAALASLSFLIFCRRAGASGAASNFTGDQLSAAFVGGGLTSGQANGVSSRINAYMTTFGINVY